MQTMRMSLRCSLLFFAALGGSSFTTGSLPGRHSHRYAYLHQHKWLHLFIEACTWLCEPASHVSMHIGNSTGVMCTHSGARAAAVDDEDEVRLGRQLQAARE